MVLIEVVRGLVPIATVAHLIALGGELSVLGVREYELLIERVKLAQSVLIHISIVLHAVVAQTCVAVIVACSHSVPCLSCLLEVAYILIADLVFVAEPCQSAVVRS